MPHTPERNAAFEKYVLGQLRCARSRIKLLLNEIDVIGMGLRSGAIGPEEAIYALHEAGTLNFLWPVPPPVRSDEEINPKENGHDGAENSPPLNR
jgi:hypothetical protein